MPRVKALFFDLDDTLIDDSGSYFSSLETTCRFIADRLSLDDWKSLNDTYHAISDALWLDFDSWGRGLGHRGVRQYVWRKALDAARLPADDRWVEDIADLYIAERTRGCQWLPGAKETLLRLRGRYLLGLITNGATEIQREKVARLNIEPLCATVQIAEESGYSKPDPRIFERALTEAGASPSDSLMIGDRPETDILGARNCGMRTAWIPMEERVPMGARGPWPYPEFQPDWTISSVAELPELLARLDEISS